MILQEVPETMAETNAEINSVEQKISQLATDPTAVLRYEELRKKVLLLLIDFCLNSSFFTWSLRLHSG